MVQVFLHWHGQVGFIFLVIYLFIYFVICLLLLLLSWSLLLLSIFFPIFICIFLNGCKLLSGGELLYCGGEYRTPFSITFRIFLAFVFNFFLNSKISFSSGFFNFYLIFILAFSLFYLFIYFYSAFLFLSRNHDYFMMCRKTIIWVLFF